MPLPPVLAQIRQHLTDTTRLYRLQGQGPLAQLLVQAWIQHEALDAPWRLELLALSALAGLDPHSLLGQRLTLWTRLADGSEFPRTGIVTQARAEQADGGFARYQLSVEPWLALLAHTVRSQVWQERSVTEIVESLFALYPQAAWRWAPCVAAHLAASANAGVRSYVVQYRQSDLEFLQHLLAREGLVMRLARQDDAPLGHELVLLADSVSRQACEEDVVSASALGGPGVRYHASGAQERQDAIQFFAGTRSLTAASSVVLGWDDEAKRAVAADMPSVQAWGGANAPALQDYDLPGVYADTQQAERAALLRRQASEAQHKRWQGRSTVRSFTAGQWFALTASELDALDALGQREEDKRFLLTRVTHAGINNLPQALSDQVVHQLGAPTLPGQDALGPELIAQARASGYGNRFEAIRASVPWRAQPPLRREYPGMLGATVVGPNGQDQASGAEEIHMDRLGRIRIRFDFQCLTQGPGTSQASTWVRVLQRWAGAGMGSQFIPRIGQEVLVDFLDGDIERPVVIGALYNGQGEAGRRPTPGGQAAQDDLSALAASGDHRPGAQGNRIGAGPGGHSPPWHGAGGGAIEAGGQNNAAALSGIKTKEFGGWGYNQLVFDDTDRQLRTQLATSQYDTQLNLGHLIHQADNHRGSFRGLGFELRTSAYGAIRGGQGVLLSSYGTQPGEPAGDNAPGIALQGQLVQLIDAFNQAARTHQTVQLADAIGSTQANGSRLSDTQPPAQALHTVLKGMVDAQDLAQAQQDAADRSTATGQDKLPHSGAAIVQVAARAGLAQVAGQDVQWSAGEGITIASGQDTHIAVGGASRIHTGQAIGVLAGAIQPGTQAQGKGITVIAGQGALDIQAQAGTLQLAAQGLVHIQSQNANVDWAAAKRIVLATAGGACVTLGGGDIDIACPGTLRINAGQKSFVGAEQANTDLGPLPKGGAFQRQFVLRSMGNGQPIPGQKYRITMADGRVIEGISDAQGATALSQAEALHATRVDVLPS